MTLSTAVLIFLGMIFLHIADDYYLQGILAQLKQKEWWKKNAPEDLYKNDYRVALFMHGMSWSIMILLPFAVWSFANGRDDASMLLLILFLVNAVIHAAVDDLKANKRKISLTVDQAIHLSQVFASYFILTICAFVGGK